MRRRKSQVPVSVSAWTKPPPAISTGGWNCVPFYQLHWVQIFIQSILLCFKECIFMWIEKTAKTTSHFHFIFYVLSQVTLYFCVLFNLLSSIINTSICRDYTILPKICFSNLYYTFSLPHASVPNLSHAFLSSIQLFFFFLIRGPWNFSHPLEHMELHELSSVYTWQRTFSALYCLVGKLAVHTSSPSCSTRPPPSVWRCQHFFFFAFSHFFLLLS